MNDPAQLLPELLDLLVALGEMAGQIRAALGGNGHRPDKANELTRQLSRGLDISSLSPDGIGNGEPRSTAQDSKGAGHE